jgi:L-amino acid N-acyltransferase YncA
VVNPPAVEVRPAELRDVPGLTALEARYYIGNVDPADRAGGFISVLHSTEWFAAAVDSGGVHVAVTEDDAVAGFIVMTAPPDRAAAGLSPIITAMLELAKTLEMNGRPIAAARYAFRGPVCIDESVRGRGVYSAFNAVIRETYRDQFELAVLFVAADNSRSLHTTTSTLGARSLAEFEADGRRYHFLAYDLG